MNIQVNTRMDDNLHPKYTCAYISDMNTGDRLDQAMRKAGFTTQKALENASGVPQPTIARILKGGGRRGPETDTLVRLAKACGVTLGWLSGESSEDYAQTLRQPARVHEHAADYANKKELQLTYANDEELSLLTKFREATAKGKQFITTAAISAEKDSKKMRAIKKA